MMNARVPMLFLGDFAAGLGAAMMKTLNQNELPGIQTSHNGDRFQGDSADLLQSTALQSLDFHKSIFDAHCAEEYARDYSQVMEKLNKMAGKRICPPVSAHYVFRSSSNW